MWVTSLEAKEGLWAISGAALRDHQDRRSERVRPDVFCEKNAKGFDVTIFDHDGGGFMDQYRRLKSPAGRFVREFPCRENTQVFVDLGQESVRSLGMPPHPSRSRCVYVIQADSPAWCVADKAIPPQSGRSFKPTAAYSSREPT